MVPQGYFHYFFSYIDENLDDPSLNQIYIFTNHNELVLNVGEYDQKQINEQV